MEILQSLELSLKLDLNHDLTSVVFALQFIAKLRFPQSESIAAFVRIGGGGLHAPHSHEAHPCHYHQPTNPMIMKC